MKNFKILLNFSSEPENLVFEDKAKLMETLKLYKDARFKTFKTRSEALKFVKNGAANQSLSLFNSIVKCEYKVDFCNDSRSLSLSFVEAEVYKHSINFGRAIDNDENQTNFPIGKHLS
jgi:hypothetical protein